MAGIVEVRSRTELLVLAVSTKETEIQFGLVRVSILLDSFLL
jgi:hypothetical protein